MTKTKKIEVLSYKPHRVVFKSLKNGQIYRVAKGYFRRRWMMGFYDIVNIGAVPLY